MQPSAARKANPWDFARMSLPGNRFHCNLQYKRIMGTRLHGNLQNIVTLQPHKTHLVLQFTMQTPRWTQAGQVPGPSTKSKHILFFGIFVKSNKIVFAFL